LAPITPVILCGGSGTRLWPLSRKLFPKQFAPLLGEKSLLQLTLERVALINRKVICVASDEHRFLVSESMAAAKVLGGVLLEPVSRNTAAAMGIASWAAEPDDLLLFCPSDHYMPDASSFVQAVQTGAHAAVAGAIVTFGVAPTFSSTGYGYIRPGALRPDGACGVAEFIEKPDKELAEALIRSGSVFWNAGIFLCRARTLQEALHRHAQEIHTACRSAMDSAERDGAFLRPDAEAFRACPALSIDYAVMEQSRDLALVSLSGHWSDVGGWTAMADLTPADEHGNRVQGQGIAMLSEGTYIHAPHRPVVALGTHDLIVVDTADAVLVADRSKAEQVRDVVAQLEARHIPQSVQHRKVFRPWGTYECVDVGERHQVKRITVRPGAKLSLQLHHHRAEHWIVVKGTALVRHGEDEIILEENQSTYIPKGVKHRLENPGTTQLEIIEVQSGEYLGEDDIVRFEDVYGRR
jgi:mannose-1-phosphate guanylyltransferase/mannose-6-phosphate isomerase